MNSGGTAAAQFPIRFADIIFAEVLDPNGQDPKTRRVVVLTPDIELAAGFPIVVAGVTGTLPNPLTSDFVKLPYKNPPGRHPKTEIGGQPLFPGVRKPTAPSATQKVADPVRSRKWVAPSAPPRVRW